MKKVLAVYGCDNGYSCSCCGEQWEEIDEDEWDFGDDLEENNEPSDEELVEHYRKHEIESDMYNRELYNLYIIEKTLI